MSHDLRIVEGFHPPAALPSLFRLVMLKNLVRVIQFPHFLFSLGTCAGIIFQVMKWASCPSVYPFLSHTLKVCDDMGFYRHSCDLILSLNGLLVSGRADRTFFTTHSSLLIRILSHSMTLVCFRELNSRLGRAC